MDRQQAMLELPTAYAVALRMHDAGASPADVARFLEVPLEAVPRLIEIGASKLDSILARADRFASGDLADAG